MLAYTEGYFEYEVADQSVTITGYFGEKTEVTVPAAIAGYPVNTIAAGAFKDTTVRKLNLPDTIMTIGQDAITQGIQVNYNSNLSEEDAQKFQPQDGTGNAGGEGDKGTGSGDEGNGESGGTSGDGSAQGNGQTTGQTTRQPSGQTSEQSGNQTTEPSTGKFGSAEEENVIEEQNVILKVESEQKAEEKAEVQGSGDDSADDTEGKTALEKIVIDLNKSDEGTIPLFAVLAVILSVAAVILAAMIIWRLRRKRRR